MTNISLKEEASSIIPTFWTFKALSIHLIASKGVLIILNISSIFCKASIVKVLLYIKVGSSLFLQEILSSLSMIEVVRM